MQTRLSSALLETETGREADRILRSCVHCGFCTATCPTYQVLGDELDGPRGRIYQIKSLLEGDGGGRTAQQHLDRCLTCLNCVTTCPSGVDYHRLLDIGRIHLEAQGVRPWHQRLLRWGLRQVLPYRRRFGLLMGLGRLARPLMPAGLRAKLPASQPVVHAEHKPHPRRMLISAGCVQPALTPATDAAAARVLDAMDISLERAGGCCGAVSHHLGAEAEGHDFMRRNVDIWWPYVEDGIEAIIVSASGCGAMVKDYAYQLRHDPAYADKAARISALTRDLVEILEAESPQPAPTAPRGISFHPPCTLQHAQKLGGRVESLLTGAGFDLRPVNDPHLCCGSAGTYSMLQPAIAGELRDRKLGSLLEGEPTLIATANVGCQTHLQTGTELPVVHWIELFDPARDWSPAA